MMEAAISKINDAIVEFFQLEMGYIDWEYKPDPEKWSKKEVIGHLIDSAQINLQRFTRCTYEENFKLIYDQVEWVEAQKYQLADVGELLDLWRLLNKQIIRVLTNYPVDRFQAQCDTGKTAINLHQVEWLASDYGDHLIHHLKQIM